MSRPIGRPHAEKPKLCHDKTSGRAFVRLAGKRRYLGRFGTRAAQDSYDRLIGEWIAQGRPRTSLIGEEERATVTQILLAFWDAAQIMYPTCRRPEGKSPVGELGCYRSAIKILRRLYGKSPADDFGPLKLEVVRNEMVKQGWSREYVNDQVGRVRRVFKWAESKELLDKKANVHDRLETLEALRYGQTDAPEGEDVPPVAAEFIDAVLPFVSRHVGAMIQLQRLGGMRPGEVLRMRLADIDRSAADVWLYKLKKHKTAHHGHNRVIYLGPKAQQILAPFLTLDPNRFLFSPADAENERREKIHQERATPLSCGNVPGSNRRKTPRRKPGERYTTDSYGRAIRRACDAADLWHKGGMVVGNDERLIPRWHPHQLRHTTGTEVREQFGAEAAQTILGHKHLKTTEIYAEKNLAQARKIMREIG